METGVTPPQSICSSQPSVPPLHYQRAVRCTSIFGLTEVCADLGENNRHVNIHCPYMTMYINIHGESEASLTSLESKVCEFMGKEDLVFVMANGLRY